MKSLGVLIGILVCTGFMSCDKSEMKESSVMQFEKLESTSCELILKLELDDEFRILDPLNIDEFDITPSDGLEVLVQFEDIENGVSECEFAEAINLISISLE